MAELQNLSLIEIAPAGSIVPVVGQIFAKISAVEFFAKLSDYGRNKNCILLESAEIVSKYGEKSMGSAFPCLKVFGKKDSFTVLALNENGERFLKAISKDLSFCKKLDVSLKKISGKIGSIPSIGVSEEERLKQKTMADVLRAIAFKLKPAVSMDFPFAGLYGMIGYDFISQFEKLPKNKTDLLKENDFELLFLDNLFLYNHREQKLELVSNAMVFGGEDRKKLQEDCVEKIFEMENALAEKSPVKGKFSKEKFSISTDTSKKEFIEIVKKCKKNILKGDVFQIVPSRTIYCNLNAEPLDVYRELRKLNPSPYMFYFNFGKILLGSSPETFLKVQSAENSPEFGKEFGKILPKTAPNRFGRKIIEIRPIAGTRARGKTEKLDKFLENELKNDFKELAEHSMLIDLARNDVAKVSIAGTRIVEGAYRVEKYSHVQHLVSTVRGILKPELDALHAYLASMNMGTLTGAPKIKAMQLLRNYEKNKRGFYGGSIGYLDVNGNFDSAIIIRSVLLNGKKAFVRAGAGIVFDSIPEKEFDETERKAKAVIEAIKKANEKSEKK